MTLMGTWAIPGLESKGMVANVDYGFFKFPVIDPTKDVVSLGPIDGLLLSKGSKKRDISLDVLYKVSKVETQRAFNVDSGAIAPNINVEHDIYNPIQLHIKELIKKSKNWAFNYDLATPPRVSEAGLNFFIEFLENPEQYIELLDALDKKLF